MACIAARTIARDITVAAIAPIAVTSAFTLAVPVDMENIVSPSPIGVHRVDRTRIAVMRHLRDFGHLRLSERSVCCHYPDRRVGSALQLLRDNLSSSHPSNRDSPCHPRVRAPATTLPVRGSITSPTAFTATSAPTTIPVSPIFTLAVPRPDFIVNFGPNILPIVAPAPAPTFPSAQALCSRPGKPYNRLLSQGES